MFRVPLRRRSARRPQPASDLPRWLQDDINYHPEKIPGSRWR